MSTKKSSGVRLIEPLGYLDFMKLVAHSKLVLTDSGGLQEETTILGIPCLTLRENTERPVTVDQGTNTLVGMDPGRIVDEAMRSLSFPPVSLTTPQYWDGRAAARIFEILLGPATSARRRDAVVAAPHIHIGSRSTERLMTQAETGSDEQPAASMR
jgi:UDP-N-acetylglucosamine 2-epimerase (non-hydrolysing)